jgi:Uma2 family endonuclease
MPDEGSGFELVDGELKELNVSKQSSRIAGRICTQFENYSVAHHPAWVFPEGTSYRCFTDDPNRVRRPDVSIIPLTRMTREQYYEDGHCCIAPDLVVEVVSPNDNAEDLEEKLREWLAAGARIVWVVYPSRQAVRIHRGDGGYAYLQAVDTLTAEGVLPGFSCPVADLFQLPGEPAPSA